MVVIRFHDCVLWIYHYHFFVEFCILMNCWLQIRWNWLKLFMWVELEWWVWCVCFIESYDTDLNWKLGFLGLKGLIYVTMKITKIFTVRLRILVSNFGEIGFLYIICCWNCFCRGRNRFLVWGKSVSATKLCVTCYCQIAETGF